MRVGLPLLLVALSSMSTSFMLVWQMPTVQGTPQVAWQLDGQVLIMAHPRNMLSGSDVQLVNTCVNQLDADPEKILLVSHHQDSAIKATATVAGNLQVWCDF